MFESPRAKSLLRKTVKAFTWVVAIIAPVKACYSYLDKAGWLTHLKVPHDLTHLHIFVAYYVGLLAIDWFFGIVVVGFVLFILISMPLVMLNIDSDLMLLPFYAAFWISTCFTLWAAIFGLRDAPFPTTDGLDIAAVIFGACILGFVYIKVFNAVKEISAELKVERK